MKRHKDKSRKPFQVGQLVQRAWMTEQLGFLLVLGMEWNFDHEAWMATCYSQRHGDSYFHWVVDLEPAGGSDES